MKNVKIYEDNERFGNFIRFAKKQNGRKLVSDSLFNKFNEIFSSISGTNSIKIFTSPFILAAGVVSYNFERTTSKFRLASIMKCSNSKIAYDEGDFTDRKGSPKLNIIGCAGSLNTKDVQKESLTNLNIIAENLHIESLNEEYYDNLDSLEIIGGNLLLSDKNIDAYMENKLLPNLKYVGGKVLVNAKECIR